MSAIRGRIGGVKLSVTPACGWGGGVEMSGSDT